MGQSNLIKKKMMVLMVAVHTYWKEKLRVHLCTLLISWELKSPKITQYDTCYTAFKRMGSTPVHCTGKW